jgi:hypothetical protein
MVIRTLILISVLARVQRFLLVEAAAKVLESRYVPDVTSGE